MRGRGFPFLPTLQGFPHYEGQPVWSEGFSLGWMFTVDCTGIGRPHKEKNNRFQVFILVKHLSILDTSLYLKSLMSDKTSKMISFQWLPWGIEVEVIFTQIHTYVTPSYNPFMTNPQFPIHSLVPFFHWLNNATLQFQTYRFYGILHAINPCLLTPFLTSSLLLSTPLSFTHRLGVQALVRVGVARESSSVLHDVSHISPSCGVERVWQCADDTTMLLLEQALCMQHCTMYQLTSRLELEDRSNSRLSSPHTCRRWASKADSLFSTIANCSPAC